MEVLNQRQVRSIAALQYTGAGIDTERVERA